MGYQNLKKKLVAKDLIGFTKQFDGKELNPLFFWCCHFLVF